MRNETIINPPVVFTVEKARQVVETLNVDAAETGDDWRYRVEADPAGKTAKIIVINETGETIGYL